MKRGLVTAAVCLLALTVIMAVSTRRHWWTLVDKATVTVDGTVVPGRVYKSTYGWYLVVSNRFPRAHQGWLGFVVAPSKNGVCGTSVQSTVVDRGRRRPADFVFAGSAVYSKQDPCDCDDEAYEETHLNSRVRAGANGVEFTGIMGEGVPGDPWRTPRIRVRW